jgi:hypothetical protein
VKFATGVAEGAADFVCCAEVIAVTSAHPIATAHALTVRKEEEI